ncbi:MAG: 30S ribosomal protein S4 [Parcubacteria group bacterium]|nr:30S ribosomal protein S4 [Parcubacteria group bacterium]
MSFVLGPKEKKSRALGENLFLKGERSQSQKSAMVRRPFRPGMHGKSRRTLSEYGLQLAEKQKVRLSYGLREKQFAKYIASALAQSKVPGQEALVRFLESRLDNVVFRAGLAQSRSVARVVVSHGHVTVNGRRADLPSLSLRPGDLVGIRLQSKSKKIFGGLEERLKKYGPPKWISLDKKELSAKVVTWPTPDETKLPFNIPLILEFYSR